MPEELLTVEQVLGRLAEGPQRIEALTDGLTEAQLHAAPGPREWSVNDVLAHLRSCGDVWGGCMLRIITEDRPAYRALSPRTWIRQTDYPDLEFRPSFRSYAAQRAELLAVLAPLPAAAWSRTARVSAVGRSLEHTVLYYADRLVRHERSHVGQIERTIDMLRRSPASR